MCGRYATSRTAATLNQEFEIDLGHSLDKLEPDFNAAPTKSLPIIVERVEAGSHLQRQLRLARWGLIPSWAKDRSIGNRMINARAESVADKPSFRNAYARRRAIVPADGYYEWYTSRAADGTAAKQPYYIHAKDGGVLALAGLYELWKDPDTGQWLTSFTIMTTSAEDSLGHIHNRMPLIVGRDDYTRWLAPEPLDGHTGHELLIPAAPGMLDTYPVSTRVGNVRNNGPELTDPIST